MKSVACRRSLAAYTSSIWAVYLLFLADPLNLQQTGLQENELVSWGISTLRGLTVGFRTYFDPWVVQNMPFHAWNHCCVSSVLTSYCLFCHRVPPQPHAATTMPHHRLVLASNEQCLVFERYKAQSFAQRPICLSNHTEGLCHYKVNTRNIPGS